MNTPKLINKEVWEKVITHNAKKKRSPKRKAPKALKKAKDVKVSSSMFAYVSMIDVHRAMHNYNSNILGSTPNSKVAAAWCAHIGVKSMQAKWFGYESWEPGRPGDYLLEVQDAHRFLQACIKWGWEPKWQQTA